MLIRLPRYVAVLLLGLIVACVPLGRKQVVAVVLPKAEVTWHSLAELCAEPRLPEPVLLESLNSLLPEACGALATINKSSNAVQLFCVPNEKCLSIAAYDAQRLPVFEASADVSYKQLQIIQQRLRDFEQQYGLLHVAKFGAIDGLIKRGLLSFEQIGINPFSKAIIASSASPLSTGVWPQGNNLAAAFESGQSYVSVQANTSLRFKAGFNDISCDDSAAATAVLTAAPEGVHQVNFINFLDGVNDTGSSYIVKHWLDLSGQLHRKTIAVNYRDGCSLAHDKNFDSAHASAYFLVIKNIAATTPIWYLPPRG